MSQIMRIDVTRVQCVGHQHVTGGVVVLARVDVRAVDPLFFREEGQVCLLCENACMPCACLRCESTDCRSLCTYMSEKDSSSCKHIQAHAKLGLPLCACSTHNKTCTPSAAPFPCPSLLVSLALISPPARRRRAEKRLSPVCTHPYSFTLCTCVFTSMCASLTPSPAH